MIKLNKTASAVERVAAINREIAEESKTLSEKLTAYRKEAEGARDRMTAALKNDNREAYRAARLDFEEADAFAKEFQNRLDSLAGSRRITNEEFGKILSDISQEVAAHSKDIEIRLEKIFTEAFELGQELSEAVGRADKALQAVQENMYGKSTPKEKRITAPLDVLNWAACGYRHYHAEHLRKSRGERPKEDFKLFFG